MKQHFVFIIMVALVSGPSFAQEKNQKQTESKQIESPQATDSRITNWILNQDKNKDGKISLEESSGLMKKNFNRVDLNDDGLIDRAELGALTKRLSANENRRTQQGMTDEQVRQRVPDGVEVELNISYREGNDAWKLDLAMPKTKSAKPRPAIVFVHGGGWTRGDKRTNLFIGQALEFAAKGYVCISINYRLDSAKLPCIEDTKCAVRWLRAHADKYNIDPDRIGAFGNSAGAHLVVMLGISHTEERLEGDGQWKEYSSAVQALAASATPTRPNLQQGTDEARKLIAPMSYVRADVPPMLLFHEESDRTVPVSNSDDFVKALKKAGAKDIHFKRYTDGSGHGVFNKNLNETVAEMEKFFARTIGNRR